MVVSKQLIQEQVRSILIPTKFMIKKKKTQIKIQMRIMRIKKNLRSKKKFLMNENMKLELKVCRLKFRLIQ